MDRKITAVAGLLVFSSALAQPVDSAQAEVKAATQAWADAFNECSAQKASALYAPDAAFWGTTSQTLITTPEAVRRYFDGACSVNPPLKVSLGEQKLRTYGETAVNSGTYAFSRTVDGQVRAAPARFSFTYRKVGGTWLIVDHHSSMLPAAMATFAPRSGG